MAGKPPMFGQSGAQSSGTMGGGGGSYGEGYSYKDKHVYISESKQGILIVTEAKVNGRKKETVIRIANAKELKKKHPEAYCYHLWYERDNQGVNSQTISGSGSAGGSGRR
jgi:hypothetical protein